MLNLKRHHHIMIVVVVLFVVAWGVWTLVLLPRSETPNLPVTPGTTAPANTK